jgi:hypothetical protein
MNMDCIKKKIDELPKLTGVYEKEMVFRSDEKKYYFKQWDYVWNYYQIIEQKDNLFSKDITLQLPSFIEIIYKMALGEDEDPDNWCTGEVILKPNKIIQTKNKIFNYQSDEDSFNDFLEEFNVRLTDANCRFTSLALTYITPTFSHRNMILIYKNDLNKKFFMYLYEPEGIVKRDVQDFLEYLTFEYNKKDNLNVVSEILPKSCPIVYSQTQTLSSGLQNIIKETGQGYCIMYSYFWLYLVLSCSKSGMNALGLINRLEDYLIENYPSNDLANIIVNFAGKCVNFYIEDIQKYVDQDVLKKFHEKSTQKFKQVMEYRQSYIRKTSLKRKQQYKQQGEDCKENSDCGSNYCDPVTLTCGY